MSRLTRRAEWLREQRDDLLICDDCAEQIVPGAASLLASLDSAAKQRINSRQLGLQVVETNVTLHCAIQPPLPAQFAPRVTCNKGSEGGN